MDWKCIYGTVLYQFNIRRSCIQHTKGGRQCPDALCQANAYSVLTLLRMPNKNDRSYQAHSTYCSEQLYYLHWCAVMWILFPNTKRSKQIRFLKWKCLNVDWNFIEFCSQVSNWQQDSISADNGLAPNRQQAIISTNDGIANYRIYASICGRLFQMHFRFNQCLGAYHEPSH